MGELIGQLSIGDADAGRCGVAQYLARIETIAASLGFKLHLAQIASYRGKWIWLAFESIELRMVAIAFGVPREDLLGQQGLAP